MDFGPGLNIISGENGTLKTKLLHTIKVSNEQQMSLHVPGHPIRRQAVSPKRNAVRRAFAAITQDIRQQNKKLDALINERQIDDGVFQDYPSLGELYYVVYTELCRDGGKQIDKMNEATVQFNNVIKHIFQNYELVSTWQDGEPQIELVREPNIQIPIEGLSLGEQEVLSLATNLYSSRNNYDVFFIDEPEVHLNWHLEEKLFDYLDYLATEHKVQLIVVSHSRVVFTQKFYPKTQFLYWEDDGRVHFSSEVTEEQRRRIAGEAIELIKLGQFHRPTFFVEDDAHELVVQKIADVLGKEIAISQCSNKNNVRSLYKLSLVEKDWKNSYFLVDGDNEGDPYMEDDQYIHLEKYCIETYLLDVPIAAQVSGNSEQEVRQHIAQSIKERRHDILKSGKNKFFEFLVDRLQDTDIIDDSLAKLDASGMFDSFVQKLGMDRNTYVEAFVKAADEANRLDQVFPKQLINAISPPEPEPAQQTTPELIVVD